MAKTYESITPELATWIGEQQMFFVASAPLAADGLVNCSPKGMDSFRVLGPRQVAYLDLTGSGIETIAHLRENGRIVFLLCSFGALPRIVRLHGRGEAIMPDSKEWSELRPRFLEHPGARAIVRADLTRISDSCGYGVPRYEFQGHRDILERSAKARGEAGMASYRSEKNARSLDGLPGLEPRTQPSAGE
ncbi:MAG TPA: pyridoxamine 5'-phosphate oxidase family protein [Planctomycetota bacterium]|nr:pyridoxamine 5'-phosphate oxidase family protein [Planctomycetota bacterium]